MHTQGMNILAMSTATTDQRTTAYGTEPDGQADSADIPPEPFFVSETFTPPSVSQVDASGVVYTPIAVSYLHRFSNKSSVYTEEAPLVTESGDASEIFWPAVGARLQFKWSRSCTQTADCEYYSSRVEAVFVSHAVPDQNDWVVLRALVKQHL